VEGRGGGRESYDVISKREEERIRVSDTDLPGW
jgi:hypothetical protein